MLRGLSDGSYKTCSVFMVGVLWAYKQDKLERLLERHSLRFILVSGFAFCVLFIGRGLIPQEGKTQLINIGLHASWFTSVLRFVVADLAAIAFSIFFIALGTRIQFHNRALSFLGSISYEIYLLQGLLFLFGRNSAWSIENDILYSFVVMLGTVTLAVFVHKIDNSLIRCSLKRISERGN